MVNYLLGDRCKIYECRCFMDCSFYELPLRAGIFQLKNRIKDRLLRQRRHYSPRSAASGRDGFHATVVDQGQFL